MTVLYAFRIFAIVLLLILSGGSNAQSGEQPKSAASEHDGPHWNYEEELGPANWGKLTPEWAICAIGRAQSPVDIDQTIQADLPEVKANFKPVQLRIIHHAHVADAINNGHTIQVNYTEGDVLLIGEEKFQLVQYHFHSPSEHTVQGKHFPMEMHLVHKSEQGKLAVIGVLIQKGKHNASFDPIWSNLPKSKGTEKHLENVTVDVNQLLPSNNATYRYDGSLTTPPCSEGVKWIIMTTPIELSEKQIGDFQSIVEANNRPVQPLHGRKIVTDSVAQSD